MFIFSSTLLLSFFPFVSPNIDFKVYILSVCVSMCVPGSVSVSLHGGALRSQRYQILEFQAVMSFLTNCWESNSGSHTLSTPQPALSRPVFPCHSTLKFPTDDLDQWFSIHGSRLFVGSNVRYPAYQILAMKILLWLGGHHTLRDCVKGSQH